MSDTREKNQENPDLADNESGEMVDETVVEFGAVREDTDADNLTDAPALDPLELEVAGLQAELADSKDQLLRTVAEMENIRKRAEKQVADARQYSVTGFARDLLAVVDNFERALSQADEASEGDAASGFVEGVKLTHRELQNVLQRHGVKQISPEGERFNPNFHQAMFEIENADVPSGTVLQVLQNGFVIGERVLRPAMVGVSKGGGKAAATSQAPTDQGQGDEPGGTIDTSA